MNVSSVKLNDRVIQIKGYAQRTPNEWPAIGLSVDDTGKSQNGTLSIVIEIYESVRKGRSN